MARNWINQNPKLVFLLVGLLVGFGVTFLVRQTDDIRIEEKISEIKELKELLTEERRNTETLRNYNQELRQKKSTYKIVKPDGTIEERTESDTQSETTISEQVKEEYERKISEKISKIEAQYSKLTIQQKKLTLNLGMDTSLNYIGHLNYNIYGPAMLGLGLNYNRNQKHMLWFTIGIKL